MKTRTVTAMVAACFAYILLILPLARGRAQASPAAPEPPSLAFPAVPALAAVPTAPAAPAVPGVPAPPAAPPSPATPAWVSEHFGMGSTHRGDGPAADCSDLHIRLDGERPKIEAEERTVTKAEAAVLRAHEVE